MPEAEFGREGCLQELWMTQELDHFAFRTQQTLQQRYFVCDKWWSGGAAASPDGKPQRRGPILFYVGNEGDVTAYVNATGLMWENAQRLGALLVFAEHRYYGASEPFGPDSWRVDPSYLTSEQALADYAVLLFNLTRSLPGAAASPVIAFGGSYGGMLASWMRMKYPHLVAGAIAASAPIASFPGTPGFKPSAFWEVVTRDATEAAGAAPECADNVRAAFRLLLSLRHDGVGRGQVTQLLRLCDAINTEADVYAAAFWVQGAFDAYAMGNYPYPSSYMTGDPDMELPAWPMRVACEHMRGQHLRPAALLGALRDAAGVLYNISGSTSCYSLDGVGPAAGNVGPWDYQFCTEMMAQEQPYFPTTGVRDMFWDQGPFNLTAIVQHCKEAWDVVPRTTWLAAEYGGRSLAAASNIVFSNGAYDPWSVFGVLEDVSPSVVALLIPEGAHHLDLMFSHPDDPLSVTAARATEVEHIQRWIAQHQEQQQQQQRGR